MFLYNIFGIDSKKGKGFFLKVNKGRKVFFIKITLVGEGGLYANNGLSNAETLDFDV